MLKQWWNRRQQKAEANRVLSAALKSVGKSRRKGDVGEPVLAKIEQSAAALKEALGRAQLDTSELERLSKRLEVECAPLGTFGKKSEFWQYAESIAWAVGIALVIRTFLFEPFKIPTGSMIPSLLIDDYIFVTKSSYGVKLPFSSSYLVRWGAPERGDVVVFPYPVKGTPDYEKDFIKRVIGLPGDKLKMRDNVLHVNGAPIAVEVLPGDVECAGPGGAPCRCILQKETLGEHQVITQHYLDRGICQNRPDWRDEFQGEMIVPEGHVFLMGDNRDNSSDGRFWGADGQLEDREMKGRTVPIELLRGRAHVIWLASDWSRMFSFIP